MVTGCAGCVTYEVVARTLVGPNYDIYHNLNSARPVNRYLGYRISRVCMHLHIVCLGMLRVSSFDSQRALIDG